MIRYNLYGMNFVTLLHANFFEDQFEILFNLPIVEYFVSILWHQHDVVGDLAIAMAEAEQFKAYHILATGGWHHCGYGAKYNLILKEAMFYRFKRAQRMGEGSLHPRPEGRGIRDPPRSRCNKSYMIKLFFYSFLPFFLMRS